jgi:hypothetical protein
MANKLFQSNGKKAKDRIGCEQRWLMIKFHACLGFAVLRQELNKHLK